MIRRLLFLVVLLGSASVWAAESCPAESERAERAKIAQTDAEPGEAAAEGASGSAAARARGGPNPPPARARWHRTLPGMFK